MSKEVPEIQDVQHLKCKAPHPPTAQMPGSNLLIFWQGSIKTHWSDFRISTYERRCGGLKLKFRAIFRPPFGASYASLIPCILVHRSKFKNRPDPS